MSYNKNVHNKKLNKKQVKKIQSNVYFWLPMMLMIGLTPLIVRAALYNPKMKKLPYGGNSEQISDFFLYNKSLVITVLGTVLIGILVVQLYMRSTKDKACRMYQVSNPSIPFLVILGTYEVLVVLSALGSKYRDYSLRGSYEQFESMWVVVMYSVIAVFCYLMLSKDEWKPILYTLLASAFVVSLIGSFQTWGKDFFASSVGRSLITAGVKGMDGSTLTMKFGDGVAYSTLYNPNYVGTYVALLLPMILAVIMATKKLVLKLCAVVVAFLMVVSLYGSGSLTGELAIGVTLVIACLSVLLHWLRYKGVWTKSINRWIGIGCGVVLVIVLLVVASSKLSSVYHRITDKGESGWDVSHVITNKEDVELSYKGEKLHVQMDTMATDGRYIKAFDQKGDELTLVPAADNAQNFTFQKQELAGLQVLYGTYKEILVFALKEGDRTWTFSNQGDKSGEYRYYNAFGKWIDLQDVDAVFFETAPTFADNRGFLWSRTIPLLKDYILLGSGPDTFTFVFPNTDYVGMVNSNYRGALVTKPHNMYLQIAVQTGFVSLLLFLALNIFYIICTIRTLKGQSWCTLESKIMLGILFGIIGYLFTGFANDSTITVAPVYWALLGTGMSFNRRKKE